MDWRWEKHNHIVSANDILDTAQRSNLHSLQPHNSVVGSQKPGGYQTALLLSDDKGKPHFYVAGTDPKIKVLEKIVNLVHANTKLSVCAFS